MYVCIYLALSINVYIYACRCVSEVGGSETNREIVSVRSHARTRGLVVRSELGKKGLGSSSFPFSLWFQEVSSSVAILAQGFLGFERTGVLGRLCFAPRGGGGYSPASQVSILCIVCVAISLLLHSIILLDYYLVLRERCHYIAVLPRLPPLLLLQKYLGNCGLTHHLFRVPGAPCRVIVVLPRLPLRSAALYYPVAPVNFVPYRHYLLALQGFCS